MLEIKEYCSEMLTVEILEDLYRVIEQCPSSTVFHDPQWQMLISRDLGICGRTLLAVDNGRPVGAMYFNQPKGRRVFNVWLSPYQTGQCVYGGPLSRYDDNEISNTLLDYAELTLRYSQIYIKTPPDINVALYQKRSYKIGSTRTLLIDLQKGDKLLWMGMDNRTRRNVKRALKNNIKVEIDGGEKFRAFYDIYQDVCRRKGLTIDSSEYYEHVFRAVSARNRAEIFYAYSGNRIVSSMIVFVHKNVINPWIGGTYENDVSLGAGSLIYWEILRHGHSIGCATYDFLGLDKDSIAFYKKGFGGYEVPVYHVSKSSYPYRIWSRVRNALARS
jgi:hypothetical protein